ncbi:MAG: exodeoxyribonuclease VII large subunit [Candidatus Omnitrophica bacterium]|nr:exodeoxyribonuclease VII large subunit [Candidatus Omnitrophota bacterium]
MSELFQKETQLKEKQHIYTVSQITQDIKLILENTFAQVWVEGELSNFKAHSSGHFYFSLKDRDAVLAAAMFSRYNKNLKFKLEDGLKVICFGKVDVYPPRGQYQLIVERVEPKGIGAQQLAFEQLKNKLLKEGLFDPAHKKPLPLMPFRIGIVTSSSGAALRDIMQILKKGSPCADLLIRSVRVQGESASREISEAIAELNEYKEVDLIVICRGGGSSEDLWSFNEERVARAVYNSKIPTISAVGHQINITLSDLAADLFVETPSAAAKIIVDKKNAILAELDGYRYELNSSISEFIHGLKNNLVALRHMLKSPLDRLLEKEQLLDELKTRLSNNMKYTLELLDQKASGLFARLNALSPLAVLSRGYSLSMILPQNSVIKDSSMLKPKDLIKTVLAKGSFIAEVKEVIKDERKNKP